MNRFTWMLVALFFGLASPCAAEMIEAPSQIVSVTVFPDRASVTRRAPLTLSAGEHTIKLSSLPSQIEPDSVSARGIGQADVILYGVRLITEQLETAQDPNVKALEQDIEKLTHQQQELSNVKKLLEQERAYLASIQAASSEQIGKDLVTKAPSATDAASILAFLDEALSKNFQRDQEADAGLQTVAKQLDKLHRELSILRQGQNRQQVAILVDLEARHEGAFQLEVSYRLPGATWQPAYEARASLNAEDVELVFSGLVRQQTGEDWNDVTMTLSTAKPSISGSMPELQPWFLRPWEPIVAENGAKLEDKFTAMRALSKNAAGGRQIAQEEMAPEAPAPKESTLATATLETSGTSMTFVLPKAVSIPADWQPHKVPIQSTSFNAQVAYETTPRLSPLAFLRAKVANTTELLYLPGPVSVFVDGAFVATSALKQVAPGETFDLFLGVDERVKIERRTLKERVDVSLLPGLRGKTKSTEYELLTTVQNFTGRKITVTVFDQVPVSQREEIVVESVVYTPETIEKNKEKPGIFHWTVDLGQHQKQELRLAYRVRHPVDMQVE